MNNYCIEGLDVVYTTERSILWDNSSNNHYNYYNDCITLCTTVKLIL